MKNSADHKLETALNDVLSTDDSQEQTYLVRQIANLIYEADDPALCLDGALVGAYVTRRRPLTMLSQDDVLTSPFAKDPLAARWHALVSNMPKGERKHHAAHVLAYLHRFSIPLVHAAYEAIDCSFPTVPIAEACIFSGERNENDLILAHAVDASFRADRGSQAEKDAIGEIVQQAPFAADKNKAVDAAAIAVFLTQDDGLSPRHERACTAWWWAASRFYVSNKPQSLLIHIQHAKQVVYRRDSYVRDYMAWLRHKAIGDLVQ